MPERIVNLITGYVETTTFYHFHPSLATAFIGTNYIVMVLPLLLTALMILTMQLYTKAYYILSFKEHCEYTNYF